MRLLLLITFWLLLLVFFPLIAIAALLLLPVVWLIALPFRLIGVLLDAVFEFLRAVLFLPARLLGARPA